MYIKKRTLVSVVPEPIKKKCLTCGTEFIPKKRRQFYCQRKCFKSMWNKKNRVPKKEDEDEAACPSYKCHGCGSLVQLSFNPRGQKGYQMFKEYSCPICQAKRSECEY